MPLASFDRAEEEGEACEPHLVLPGRLLLAALAAYQARRRFLRRFARRARGFGVEPCGLSRVPLLDYPKID